MTKFGEIPLRECPFCGKDPDEPFFDGVDYGCDAAIIRCSRCDLEIREVVNMSLDSKTPAMIRLVLRWNTRAKDLKTDEELGGWLIEDNQ